MVQPLLGKFGYTATKHNVIQVVEGIYIPPEGTSKHAQDFLAVCKIPECIRQRQEIQLEVSEEENARSWKRMEEKTASAIGPISTNFSHFKATATDTKMNSLMTFFRNFTTKFDVIPESWLTVTDLIILKQSGEHNIDCMRTIQLFDPEFNMINKILEFK